MQNDAEVVYPTRIKFSLEARGDAEIRIVEVEYGVAGRDCSPDVVLAVPDHVVPGTTVQVQWVWNIAKLGNLPPGMRIWWDWHLVDVDGNETRFV